MKNLIVVILFFVMIGSTTAYASASNINPSAVTVVNGKAEADRIVSRVNEIQKMDKKKLSSAERKALKAELISMKHKMSEPGFGIYISGTALLLIIILLILFL